MVNLTDIEINDLKTRTPDLETSISQIYQTRTPRNLYGEDGIILRTFGKGYRNPGRYNPHYLDARRNKEVKTEYAEFIEAMREYDEKHSDDNTLALLLEAGDLLFQRKVVELYHSKSKYFGHVIEMFSSVLNHVEHELEIRGFNMACVKSLAEIKYGARARLSQLGRDSNAEELEQRICLEYLKDHNEL